MVYLPTFQSKGALLQIAAKPLVAIDWNKLTS